MGNSLASKRLASLISLSYHHNYGRAGNSRVSTVRGARIGDTESKIKSLYPGQIRVTRHHYQSNGHYLIFTPKDRSEANYRIIFETDGNRVTNFRAGKLPEVEWVEGCS
ncbi:MAG TPA: hypothetical protein DCP31_13915 [Cyanobacteria bacterium UBA8543]|nr:hypothetical protein [Cyanobacteria bacterium UBA8543]